MEQLKPCPFCGSTNVVAMHNSERDEQIVPQNGREIEHMDGRVSGMPFRDGI